MGEKDNDREKPTENLRRCLHGNKIPFLEIIYSTLLDLYHNATVTLFFPHNCSSQRDTFASAVPAGVRDELYMFWSI